MKVQEFLKARPNRPGLAGLQVSSNLVDWVSLATNSPVHGVFSYSASPLPNTPALYYRLVLLP